MGAAAPHGVLHHRDPYVLGPFGAIDVLHQVLPLLEPKCAPPHPMEFSKHAPYVFGPFGADSGPRLVGAPAP